MAMHIYTSSGWKAVNQNGGVLDDRGLAYYDAGFWQNATNAKIRTSGGWTGFLDNITLYDDYVQGNGFDFANASWGINSTNGNIVTGGDVSVETAFCANQANLGQYEIKVDISIGSFSFPSASTGTWISCTGSPFWQIYTGNGESDVTFTASVRNAITTEVLATSIITLYVNAQQG
jgi:hypothetical protein